jgi:hypothetical protein
VLVRVDSRGASMGTNLQTWFMGCYEMQATQPGFGSLTPRAFTGDTTAATDTSGDTCDTWPCDPAFRSLDAVMTKNFSVIPSGLNRSCTCPLYLASSVYKVTVTPTTSWEWYINATTNTVSIPIP